MIVLTHRSASGDLDNLWEYDPARRSVDVVIGGFGLTLPVCRPDAYARCAHFGASDHDHHCWSGYPIAERAAGEWVIASDRFHALLPRDSLLLARSPEPITFELRAL